MQALDLTRLFDYVALRCSPPNLLDAFTPMTALSEQATTSGTQATKSF